MAEEKMRLYEVEITFRTVVVAESERDAELVFSGSRHDILSDSDPDVWASPCRAIPSGWSKGCIPYSDLDRDHPRRDWTAERWLEATTEEDAQAKRESEFAARQVPLPIG